MKLFYLRYILLFLALTFSNCKKEKRFPEDPKKSRKTPQSRFSGKWIISAYTFNGNDIRFDLNKLSNKYRIDDVYFTYEYNDFYRRWDFSLRTDNYGFFYSTEGFKDNTYIYLSGSNDTIANKWFYTPFKYIKGSSVYWTITKLYDKDCNLILDTDSGQYKMFLNKIKL
ncbi:MAG: hypothetical protein HYX39_05210 [Bacteroidetes bacterium]|nr:hypothetical protein [Bacteroidota bacterium]